MNRDERHTRERSLPPQVFGNAIYPSEPNGGTWLAVNTSGLTLALLNRNVEGIMPARLRGRGELIPALISSTSLPEIYRRLIGFDFKGMLPCRLIAISPAEREICEWHCTPAARVSYPSFEWKPMHWYSSGMSDFEAQKQRNGVVQAAWKQPDAGSLDWLRNLHRSHEPKRGAFSMCVHRDDASTVSYSEISFDEQQISFHYAAGSPCETTGFDTVVSLPVSTAVPSMR